MRMDVVNAVWPEESQIKAMGEKGPDGPIVMVNLLKFRDKAQYADGRESSLTGREAYGLYSEVVVPLLERFGARILFAGDVTHLAIGRCAPLWDEVALAEYPARGALTEMAASSEWREAAVHREAGLAGQLNIETTWMNGLREMLTRG